MSGTSTLVHNERTKLTANALDRASTACFVAGVIFVDENGEGPGVRLRKASGGMG